MQENLHDKVETVHRLENSLLEANNQLNQYEVDCSLWQDRYEELLLEYRESAQQFDVASRRLEEQRLELQRREDKLSRLRKEEILYKTNRFFLEISLHKSLVFF